MQTTLNSPVTFRGIGLHTGAPVCMTLHPAPAEHGVFFRRRDVSGRDPYIQARWDRVVSANLCTKIENEAGVSVSTIEHVMAALAGCGVHNVLIEIDGPEVPILDGSSAEFVRGIVWAGLRHLNAEVVAIEVLRTVDVENGPASARLEPAPFLQMDYEIDFEDAAIGRQRRAMSLGNGAFVRVLCDSRTFCRQRDVEQMRANGLALGGSLDNAVVVDGDRVLTPGGLRHADEAVRHKMLDALGDLATAGAPILGRYVGRRAGHAMTNTLLRALFADKSAYRLVVCSDAMAARLPGVGVRVADLRAVA